MKKLILLSLVIAFSGCSIFRGCNCEPQLEENKKLIVPKELQLPEPK